MRSLGSQLQSEIRVGAHKSVPDSRQQALPKANTSGIDEDAECGRPLWDPNLQDFTSVAAPACKILAKSCPCHNDSQRSQPTHWRAHLAGLHQYVFAIWTSKSLRTQDHSLPENGRGGGETFGGVRDRWGARFNSLIHWGYHVTPCGVHNSFHL